MGPTAKGVATIEGINSGQYGKCSHHDAEITDMKKNQSDLHTCIDKNRTETMEAIKGIYDVINGAKNWLIGSLVVWFISILGFLAYELLSHLSKGG